MGSGHMKTQFFVLSLHCCKLLTSSRIFSLLFTEGFESCFKTHGNFPKSEDILDEEKKCSKNSHLKEYVFKKL